MGGAATTFVCAHSVVRRCIALRSMHPTLAGKSFAVDFDIIVASMGLITDSMAIESDGNLNLDRAAEDSSGFSFGIGPGAGASQIETEGDYIEFKLFPTEDEWEDFTGEVCGSQCQ